MQDELFEKQPIPKAYLTLALPVVLGMVVSLIYNMVDTIFIAKTADTNLIAGVSLCTPIFTLMVAIGDIFGVGGSSVISRLFGKKCNEDGTRLSVFCFYAALFTGILVLVVMLLAKKQILYALGADEETYFHAARYYQWIVLGAPLIIVSYTPHNLLRTEGFAKASMAGTMLGAIVNVILDPLFIFTLEMGAAGAAIATVIGNLCVDIFYLSFLTKKCRYLSINPKGLYISEGEIGQIFAIGIPASITNLMQSIGIALTNRFLQGYGNEKVAVMGIVLKIVMIAVLVMVGIAFGGQPLIGYTYGAGNHVRLKKTLRFAFLLECGIGIAMAVFLGIFSSPIVGMFLSDGELARMASDMLRIQLLSMPFVGMVLAATCSFQSAGKAGSALALSASRQGIVFAAVLVVLSYAAGYQGILFAQPLSDVLTASLAFVLLRRWIKKEKL
ncbi:MAG: MATE family efflux transporter [Fusicatenibacter sp.]|nr:MATE family efflux transporter [Fusicatenibacter sp.]